MKKIIFITTLSIIIVVGLVGCFLYFGRKIANAPSSGEEIQKLLAEKYKKPIADVHVKVNRQTSDYMSGSMNFDAKGLPPGGPGGVFLAAKVNNLWTLVYAGNGSIDCIKIKQQYNFPAEMLKNFCD